MTRKGISLLCACLTALLFQSLAAAAPGLLSQNNLKEEGLLTEKSLREAVENVPNIDKVHGMLDNEHTAVWEMFEQALEGKSLYIGDDTGEQQDGPGGDVRIWDGNDLFDGHQNEFQIAIHPNNPLIALGTSNSGHTAGVGIYRTINGGVDWTEMDAPTGLAGCCDPAVVIAPDGVAYVGVLKTTTPAGQITLRSADTGGSWSLVAFAAEPDRNNLAVDPNNSNIVYTTYSDLGSPPTNRIKGYRSDDGGATWGTNFFVGPPAPPLGYEQSSQPRVAVDGTLYVGFQQYMNSGLGCNAGVQNVVSTSTDGGGSFTHYIWDIIQGGACIPGQAGRGIFCINAGGSSFRSRSHPILGMHPYNPQIVYVVYSGGELDTTYSCGGGTGRHADILFMKSTDGAQSFSAPVKVNTDDPGSDQYFPWMEVAGDGTIWIGWNDRRDDPSNFKSLWYQAVSTDEGATWLEMPVATVQTQPSTFIGDYHGLSAHHLKVMGMWYDSRNNPSGDPYTHPTDVCSQCYLQATQIALSCNADQTTHYVATLTNSGPCTINATYSAALQRSQMGGDFQTIQTQNGSGSFDPGDTVISGDFCYVPETDGELTRVQLTTNPSNPTCSNTQTSDAAAACTRADACP